MNDTETKTSPEIEAAIEAAKAGDWMPAVTLWLADDKASSDDFVQARDDDDGFWGDWYRSSRIDGSGVDGSIVDLQEHFEAWCFTMPSAEAIVDQIGEPVDCNHEWCEIETTIFHALVMLYVADAKAAELAIRELKQETKEKLAEQTETLLARMRDKNRPDTLFDRLIAVDVGDTTQGDQVSAYLRATMVAAGVPLNPQLHNQIMLLLAAASEE